MKIPPHIATYGPKDYRGECPREDQEQVSFFNRLRRAFPTSYGLIAFHPRNEGLKQMGQFSSVQKHRAEGGLKGVSDVIIPGKPTFVCEIKRRDHTKSKWQDGQIEFLTAAQEAGAFVAVAFGAVGAWDAFMHYKELYHDKK